MPQEEESRKIAKRAVKISLFCVGIVLIFAVITLYVLITQISATAGISHKVTELEQKLHKIQQD
ncbi:MAG: DUF5408 family protein [Helicobacter sp.]|uniref:DUF5408 family protein n=1 Tax=Helicobacter sp. 10-6591 TaxID=2004998 RepID=UPI000DCB4C55|nr:DUF5408 family protein [Helicobacter sp. 10-6591]MCI7485164.1 DUF5408 family protein [Helicobacter sp.]MDD7566907.1 DUF5408 family protein [Helicobacter sp.]MDY5740718.1 DUF5408 family protein [Helicobacter sp.]RAX53940.1 hypothetical protein CCY97_06825 [Helicobacter sp. 10-6591]